MPRHVIANFLGNQAQYPMATRRAILRYAERPTKLPSISARLFCEFSSLEECKSIVFNVVYADVSTICEEKFDGCWWWLS